MVVSLRRVVYRTVYYIHVYYVHVYYAVLSIDYGLIKRRIPFTVNNPERTRHARYVLADNYLAYWFHFVLPNRSALEQGQASYVWHETIVPQLSAYMGTRFESLCRQFIRLNPTRWTHPVPELGVWWNIANELDIVGHDHQRVVLAAEATWTNSPVGTDVLQTLRRRVALLPDVDPACQLVLFSRSGFTSALQAIHDPIVTLVSLDDMYSV